MQPQDIAAIDYEAVVSEVRAEMGRRRLSGQRLADMSGLTQSTVSRRLNGSPFTLPEMLAICAALGISLRELLADADAKRPQLVARGAVVAGAGFEPATSGIRDGRPRRSTSPYRFTHSDRAAGRHLALVGSLTA